MQKSQPRTPGRAPTSKLKAPVKQEPGALVAPSNAVRKLTPAAMARTVPVTVPTVSDDDGASSRRVRSGAPSIDTRPIMTSHLGDDQTTNDGTTDVLLREVRPRIKLPSEQEEEMPTQQTKSFVSTHRSFALFGQQLKTINDALGKLQTLGIQHVTQLPELVLVGDQSSGKSSLMSALANLNLPRSTGICTRCPIHIRISSGSSEWRCNVSLHRDYYYESQQGPISSADVHGRDPFPPWRKMPQRIVQDFKTIEITSESVLADIERVIRWAQVAILNDRAPYHQFIPQISTEEGYQADGMEQALLQLENSTPAKFSPNRVALEIRGPEFADMSFYDLPGVFANTPDQRDEYLVKVVKNLAAEYISHPSAIILWAVPMNADPDTSETFRLIRDGKALDRCVSVLTKADLVPQTDHGQWLKLLRGESYQTGQGFFITARPHQRIGEPDAFEEAYFNRTAHAPHSTVGWPEQFAEFDERCGVSKLKQTLSQLLGREFSKSIPQVRRKIEAKLRNLEQQLAQYPDMPQNPELEVRQAVAQYTVAVRDYLNQHARSHWGTIQQNFADHVKRLKPKFIVKPETSHVEVNGVINLADTESVRSANSTAVVKRRLPSEDVGPFVTPASKRRVGPNGTKIEEQSPFALPTARNLFNSPNTPAGRRSGRSLRELHQLIESRKNPGVPNLIPQNVFEDLCRESVQPWNIPVEQLIRDSAHTLNLHFGNILAQNMGSLDKRAIYRHVGQHMQSFVKEAIEGLQSDLFKLYRLETRQMFTFDSSSLNLHKAEELRTLTRHRHHFRAIAAQLPGAADRGLPKDWATLNEEEKKEEMSRMAKEAHKLGPDPLAAELDVAAYIRGYYLTAASRFIDTVLLHITSGLFPDLADQLTMYLEQKLEMPGIGAGDPANRFRELMTEDAKDAERREFLKMEREKFVQARASIEGLEGPMATGADTEATLVSEEDEPGFVLVDDDDVYMIET